MPTDYTWFRPRRILAAPVLVLIPVLVLSLVLSLGRPSRAGADIPAQGDAGGLGTLDVLQAVSQAKGKVVVLNFWASWCGPCRAEIPELKDLRQAFGPEELYLLGVSVDQDRAMYETFVGKAGFNYPVGLGSREVVDMFHISQVPTLMVYDPQGRLVVNRPGTMDAEDLSALVRRLLGG